MSLTPGERTLRSRLAAHTLHAHGDSNAIAARARAGFLARFEREVDPDGVLSEAERAKRAEHARRAYFARLALKSARARRARKAAGTG